MSKFKKSRSAIEMWEERAKQHGARAALNIGHSIEEFDSVTQLQKEKIFPILESVLTGNEKLVLDFGCGPGRFSSDLANLIEGKVIGVDPIQSFLNIAPLHDKVEYRLLKHGVIPVASRSVDIVWICLVLGGVIKNKELNKIVVEISRVLKPGGLVMLIENTTDATDVPHWKYHPIEFYQFLFDFVNLEHSSDYYDLGERISIMLGRTHV